MHHPCMHAGKHGAGSMDGACGLLGAAFPNITSLKLDMFNSGVQLMSGLAACSRLAKLDLGRTELAAEMTACVHLLPAWLPHVHMLIWNNDAGALALARGLSAQLRDLQIDGESDPAGVAAVLVTCTQLVSLELSTLYQATMDALVALPTLREVETLWSPHLTSQLCRSCRSTNTTCCSCATQSPEAGRWWSLLISVGPTWSQH